MDVIDTTFEVTIVAYLVFPKTPLPKIRFPALDPRCAARLDRYQRVGWGEPYEPQHFAAK